MRSTAHLLALYCATTILMANCVCAQEIATARAIASAKTVYFEDRSGVDAVGRKASEELAKWGRFLIVPRPQGADLIVLLTTDPRDGGNLVLSGQTGSVDTQGRVQEDSVPTYNKLNAVRQAFLIVKDGHSGTDLWSASERWGGLLTGFNSVGEHLVKEFEKRTALAEEQTHLKALKQVQPTYPAEALAKHIEGTVVVSMEVDKNGMVSRAKAISGPTELFQASVNVAKQYQFAPPEHAPVTTEVEITYSLEPNPCASGQKGSQAVVETSGIAANAGRPGQLKILEEINAPSPTYPQKAREEGIEGELDLVITVGRTGEVIGVHVSKPLDPVIDSAAEATVRSWKFKVSRGEPASYPLVIRYILACSAN
jgi:TonB family protein